MPITIGPDPSNPSGQTWVDQKTGLPAIQPGGPGTAIIAPSDYSASELAKMNLRPEDIAKLSPDLQQQVQASMRTQSGLPASDVTDAQKSAVLNAIQRPGWNVVGRTAKQGTVETTDPRTGTTTRQTGPTGEEVWAISGPNGENDTVGVRPNTTGGFEVTDPPKNLPTKTSSTTAPTSHQTTVTNLDGSTDTYTYLWRPDASLPNGGEFVLDKSMPPEHKPGPAGPKKPTDPSQWVPIHANPADPNSRVIYLQDPNDASSRVPVPDATPKNPQIVNRPDGSTYSWDGTTLSQLLPATPEKRQIIQGQNGKVMAWDGQNLTIVEPGTAPKEGDTRYPIQNGYRTTQTYTGGDWITTDMGQKAIPTPPQQATANATELYRSMYNPDTGQYTDQPNPNFIAKTQADVAAKAGQLQQMAAAKQAELQQKIGPAYSRDQALADFQGWWKQTIDPQKSALDIAQQQAAQEQQRVLTEQQRQNYSTAMTAGQNAVANVKDLIPNFVGPGFRDTINQLAGSWSNLKAPMPNLDVASAVMYKTPDLNAIGQKAVADALAHISPTAAGISGGGPPQVPNMNINQMLNPTAYTFTGGPGGGPPQTIPGTPPGPTPEQLANQNAAAAGITNIGAFSGPMPAPAAAAYQPLPAWSQPAPNFGAIPTTWPPYSYTG